MAKLRECFVCATLLAEREKQRVEVRHKQDRKLEMEVCGACWTKVRRRRVLRIVKKGRTYEVRVRRLQMGLLKRTAREMKWGG